MWRASSVHHNVASSCGGAVAFGAAWTIWPIASKTAASPEEAAHRIAISPGTGHWGGLPGAGY